MELKLQKSKSERATAARSNRTFMELKLLYALDSFKIVSVLIAPLWN